MEHQAVAFTRMRTISHHLCDSDSASLLWSPDGGCYMSPFLGQSLASLTSNLIFNTSAPNFAIPISSRTSYVRSIDF